MKNVKISIFTTKWGHRSIAEAVSESLKTNPIYHTCFNFIPVEKASELIYMPGYRLFPKVFKYTFKIAEQENIAKIITKFLNQRYKRKIEELIRTQKPQVVINTYFAFNPILEYLSEIYNFLYINVVADPRSIHKIILSKRGFNFVFDKKAKGICKKTWIEDKKLITSGWFVQNKFHNGLEKKDLRKKLDINSDDFVVLAVGGSAGNYSILKTLPAFLNSDRKIALIVVCGDSKTLFRSTKLFSELFSSEKLKIISVKFTKDLDQYIKVSDLVIGKAGPNFLFETIACRKPIVAVSHIHGQEDGNLEIIKEYKLGYVEENPVKLVKLLREIIRNPKKLDKFKKHIVKLAEYNEGSGKIINDFIQSKINS